jgi:hypothetical protein
MESTDAGTQIQKRKLTMKARIKTVVSMALGALALMAPVHSWAVSPSSTFSTSRQNTAGSAFVNMTSSATTFCYLRSVGFRDTDSSTELATCRVTRGSIVWTLEAVLSQNDDADAFCSAQCYNN